MKILQIHKYYSKKRGGGSVAAFFETKELLEKRGHEVIVFSMNDPDNELSVYSKFFARHFDIRDSKNFFHKIFLLPRILYNPNAVRQLDQLLTFVKPDVAHVHNIYHYLTPGIFRVLKKHNVPIVFKLSDYHAICPNYKLFAHGKIDTSCEGGKYYKLFFNKSINNSWAESFVAMIEGYFNAWRKFYDDVDLFTAPSIFMRDLCIKYGIPAEKIVLLRNVLNFDAYDTFCERKKEKFFLYMGRLAPEKGLKTAIDAMAILKERKMLGVWRLVIAGDGPEKEKLRAYATQKNVKDVVGFAGFCKKGSEQWHELMCKASVALLPSIWYDNSPIAISESMAFSTPVIVSDYGGTKEMIVDGRSGFVFKASNAKDLADTMRNFIVDKGLIREMGKNARVRALAINNEDDYYHSLMDIYRKVIAKKNV